MKRRLTILLASALLAVAALGSAASPAAALTTSCAHASDHAGWSVGWLTSSGQGGASGQVNMTAYFCWNGQDSWSDSNFATNATYSSTISRTGDVTTATTTLIAREKWASGSTTVFRNTMRIKLYKGTATCFFDGSITISVNLNGVATGSTSGPFNNSWSTGVCSVNGWGRYF